MQLFDIKSAYPDEIYDFISSIGESRYRADQIMNALSQGLGFDEMTTLSKALREKLKELCVLPEAEIENKLISKLDGTIKYLF